MPSRSDHNLFRFMAASTKFGIPRRTGCRHLLVLDRDIYTLQDMRHATAVGTTACSDGLALPPAVCCLTV